MNDNERCCVRVYTNGSIFHSTRCLHKATVERNGESYCGQHDPEKVAARRAKSEEAAREKHNTSLHRRIAAQQFADALGVGTPHYDSVILHGYTGGIVLSAEEAERLIARMERE